MSLLYRTASTLGTGHFTRFKPTVRGIYQPCHLIVEYFAEQHRAGTRFWSEHEAGKECLARLARIANVKRR